MDTLMSSKGNPIILFDGYLLRMNYVKQNSFEIYWKCTDFYCKAGVFTTCNNRVIQVKNELHNHERPQPFPKIVMTEKDKRKAMMEIVERQSNKRKRRSIMSYQSAGISSTVLPLVKTPLSHHGKMEKIFIEANNFQTAGQATEGRCMEVCCNSDLYNPYDCFMHYLNQYICKYISTKIINNEVIDLEDYLLCRHYQQELLKKIQFV